MKKIFRGILIVLLVLAISGVGSALGEAGEGEMMDFPQMDEAEMKILEENEQPEDNAEEVEIIDDEELEKLLEEESSDEPWIPEDAEKGIIGKDNRINVRNPAAYPFRCIAYMFCYGSCGHSWTGSGFMISKNSLLTAAHCVICSTCNKWAKAITFNFGYSNSRNIYYTYNGGWTAWAGNMRSNDCAVVKFKSNVGQKTGWFGYKINANPSGKQIYVAGYRDGALKYGTGKASVNGNYLRYTIDTVPGNSGGPVFDSSNYTYGIHIQGNGSYNSAYRLNSFAYSLIKKAK